jgi:HK97 family phage portal protein
MLQAMGLSSQPIEGEATTPEGTYGADVSPPSRTRGETLSLQRAMGLPAVFRSVQLIAGMCAQLTLESWRGQELVDPQPVMVTHPDPWRTADSWVERFAINLATDGNNFTWKQRVGDSLTALTILNPFTVNVLWKTINGRRVKRYAFPHPVTGKRHEVGESEIIHTWALEVPGLDRGLGPIGHTKAALTGVIDLREYADRWFRDEATDGVLTSEQPIDQAAAKQAKKLWYAHDPEDPYGPRLRVMGKGLKYDPIMLRPEEAQWLEAQNFGVLDISRIFGVPPEYLAAAVDGTAMTYSNLVMIDTQFLRTTLFPVYLRKIQNAVTQALPRGQRAEFRTSDLLQPDASTRSTIDKAYVDMGVYDAAYIRRRDRITGSAPAKPARADSNLGRRDDDAGAQTAAFDMGVQ